MQQPPFPKKPHAPPVHFVQPSPVIPTEVDRLVGTVKNDDGNIPYSALSPEQRRRYDLLLAGLDLLDQAIAVFDATPKLVT